MMAVVFKDWLCGGFLFFAVGDWGRLEVGASNSSGSKLPS